MKDNIVKEKSYLFALRIIKLYQYLQDKKKENILSKQILRSGTAIGALISEGKFAQSKADFVNKMHVALKEANETSYWLALLKDSEYISVNSYNSIDAECDELIKLLASIVKTSKNNS
jgi:four helix bundle protein